MESYLKFLYGCIFSFIISAPAIAQLEAMISGGFSGPYNQILPAFEHPLVQAIIKQ